MKTILIVAALTVIAALAPLALPQPASRGHELCLVPNLAAMGYEPLEELTVQQQQEPETPPSQEQHEPTVACTPHDTSVAKACGCRMQNPEGCKQGKREVESPMCRSYCWKSWCHCCSS